MVVNSSRCFLARCQHCCRKVEFEIGHPGDFLTGAGNDTREKYFTEPLARRDLRIYRRIYVLEVPKHIPHLIQPTA